MITKADAVLVKNGATIIEDDDCSTGYSRHVADSLHGLATRLEAEAGEVERLRAEKCTHGWRGRAPERAQVIKDPCPVCGCQIFIGDGGWLTCASVPGKDDRGGCPQPGVGRAIADLRAELAARPDVAGELKGLASVMADGMNSNDHKTLLRAAGIWTRERGGGKEGRDE